MHTVATFVLLGVVAEAQLPSSQTRHHTSLTGGGKPMPELFIRGHVRDNFVIKPQDRHHDALTGHKQAIPDLFIKGHVRDNFVIKPQDRHHDLLTGRGPQLPDQYIKGHVADPLPSSVEGYSLKKPMVADKAIPIMSEEFAASMREELTFCKISADQCSQYTLTKNWVEVATTFGSFKAGTCWEHGYTLSKGSKEISLPLIGKTNLRIFKKSKGETSPMEVFSQTSPYVTSVRAVALISLVATSGAIFAMLHVRRGTFMFGKESLLATSRL